MWMTHSMNLQRTSYFQMLSQLNIFPGETDVHYQSVYVMLPIVIYSTSDKRRHLKTFWLSECSLSDLTIKLALVHA